MFLARSILRALTMLHGIVGKLRKVWAKACAPISHAVSRRREESLAVRERIHAKREALPAASAAADAVLKGEEKLLFPHAEGPALSVIVRMSGDAIADIVSLRGLSSWGSKAESLAGVDGRPGLEVFLVGRAPVALPVVVKDGFVSFEEAAKRADAPHLLFIGAGVRVPSREAGGLAGIERAMEILASDSRIGAVGGRLVGADGRVEEAGRVFSEEASSISLSVAYGRDEAAEAPSVMFRREVDACSADCLLVSRDLFISLGGFGPADPTAEWSAVVAGDEWGRRLAKSNRCVLFAPVLDSRRALPETGKNSSPASQTPPLTLLLGRDRRRARARVLLIEDRVPYPWLGAGFPRSAELLTALVQMDCAVTLYPTLYSAETWDDVYRFVDPRVEVMVGSLGLDFARFWRQRRGFYDLCIVSRPHNMAQLRGWLLRSCVPIVYDAEALYCLRLLSQRRLLRLRTPLSMERRRIAGEVGLARGSAAVVSVSDREAAHFRTALDSERHPPRFYVLRHTVPHGATEAGFAQRRGVLFIGTFHDALSPNADSVQWFLKEIYPRFLQAVAASGEAVPPPFLIAGTNPAGLDFSHEPHVETFGRVDDLTPIYNRARVFVAPTRYAAGVPLKLYEAAARGVPIVATPLLAEQLGWQPDVEMLAAGDAASFADACGRLHGDQALWSRVRENALRRIAAECSPEEFQATVGRIVTENIGQAHKRSQRIT